MKLRGYQTYGLGLIRKALADENKRILVQSPTGSGKTEIIFHIVKKYVESGKKVLFLVRRRQIVFQTHRRLIDSGFYDVSIFMSGQRSFPSKQVQICSIDTIISKVKSSLDECQFLREADLVIVDEAHDSTSDSYRSFFSWLEGRPLKEYKRNSHLDKPFEKTYMGFTATPYRVGKKTQDFWKACVVVTTSEKLKDEGYLSDANLFVPMSINTKGLRVESTGDYNQKQAFEASSKKIVMGKIVKEYKARGLGLPAICFAVNKRHSIMLAKSFMDAGIEAVHVEDSTRQSERDLAISRLKECFREKKSFVLCNVNIFSTGVDIPEACVGVMARPTDSKILWYQQVGRMFRICKGKNKAIIIDHAGNSLRFGGIFNYHYPELQPSKKEEEREKVTVCPACCNFHPKIVEVCEFCGIHIKSFMMTFKSGEERVISSDEEFSMVDFEATLMDEMRAYVKKNLLFEQNVHVKSEKEIWSKVFRKYGDMFLKHYEELGCPDYVRQGIIRDSLLASSGNIKQAMYGIKEITL